MRKFAIYNVQANRFTGDTFQTAGATTTRYKQRKLNDKEKKNPARMAPYFKQHEWLIGNSAFIEATYPSVYATKPVTGTGVCHLPTTVESLQKYFSDPVSQQVFTDHLRLAFAPQNLETIRTYSEATEYIYDHHPYWKVTEKTIKPQWANHPLFRWIAFRLNWAYYYREAIRRLYDRQLSHISTGMYVNNTRYTKRHGESVGGFSQTTPPLDPKTALSSEKLEAEAASNPYNKYFELLSQQMEKFNVTIMNVTFRSTSLPVRTNLHDPYVSRDELSSALFTNAHRYQSENGPPRKSVNNHTKFTYHRYWALYYISLLERFIESHTDILRFFCHDHEEMYFLQPPPAPSLPRSLMTQVNAYIVPTVFHPYDELAARWEWTPIQGHQGSRAILQERFPDQFVFQIPFVYLYHLMQGKLPLCIMPLEKQEEIYTAMVKAATKTQDEWDAHPLIPRDLLQGNTNWTLSTVYPPFDEDEPQSLHFLWTFAAVVGEISRLQRAIGDPNQRHAYIADDQEREFYEHQLQVRLTGYLPITRWILTELLIHEQTQIVDERVTEAVEYYNYDEIDFDAELDLPCLHSILHLLNYWYTSNGQVKKNPILMAYQKTLPFRSMGRVLSNHFFKETKRNPHFISLTTMFVAASSLGVFRRMKDAPKMVRPSMETMAKIDFAILQTPRQLFNFIHVTKSKIIMYMSREVLIHGMADAPHYRDHQIVDWPMLEKHTWQVCNVIREYLRDYKFWLKAPFNLARVTLEENIQLFFEKRYDIFLFPQKDFLHSILHVFYVLHIRHLDNIILLQAELRRLLNQHRTTLDADALGELNGKIERCQLELAAMQYDLKEEVRNVIWQTMIGKRNDIDIWSLIRQWIDDNDLILFHRIHEAYVNHTPPKKLEVMVSHLSLSAFTMIYYLLQVQKFLKQFHVMPLPAAMMDEIHLAMRQEKHHLFDTQSISSAVYHVHVTACCNRVITLADTNSYGNSHLMYNRTLRYYACCRKKSNKLGLALASSSGSASASTATKPKAAKKSSDEEYDDEEEEGDDEEEEEEEEEEDEEEDEEEEEEDNNEDEDDNDDDHNESELAENPSREEDSSVSLANSIITQTTEDERQLLKKIEARKRREAKIAETARRNIERSKTNSNLVDNIRTKKDITMDDYPNMSFKERRKIACRLDADMKPLSCRNNPPVLTFDLQGCRLLYGSEYSKTTTYQHCPKCGDLHTYSLKHYNNGNGYKCANCTQKYWAPPLDMQRMLFCVYCGRQQFKNVANGLDQIKALDIGDHLNPIKLFCFCHADAPKNKYDFLFDRHATTRGDQIRVLVLDSYLQRHNAMMYVQSAAHFPFQNTVQEDAAQLPISKNGFSWPNYGQRANQIPQLIDVWWPSFPDFPERLLI